MCSNLSITDQVYGILSVANVGKRTMGLWQKLAAGDNPQEGMASQMLMLAEMLMKSAFVPGTK